jgi:hypothetical protein
MRKITRPVAVAALAAPLVLAGAGVAAADPITSILSTLTDTTTSGQEITQGVTQDQSNETNQSNDADSATTIGDATDGLIPVDVDALTAPIFGGDTDVAGSTDQGNANETSQGQEAGQAATGGDQG